MYEVILVPLDGSNAAEIVLPYTIEIGAKLGSEITLASVSETHATNIDHLYQSYLDRIKNEMHELVKDYSREELRVFSKILLGKPADEILRYADETNAGLIVMASRGSSGQGPWLLGNIAAKVLRATTRPVLLVRAPASEAALREKRLIRRILVPLDESEVGEAALPSTEALALGLGADLILFRVLEPIAVMAGEDGYSSAHIPSNEESRKASAMQYLDGIGKKLKGKGLGVSSVVVIGSSADQIIDYAKANTIDLIAMSTHGRTGIGRWVFGSVTDKVLHAGDTPVLVARTSKT
jgi:nucleotide-binding universal stress UspA family protein